MREALACEWTTLRCDPASGDQPPILRRGRLECGCSELLVGAHKFCHDANSLWNLLWGRTLHQRDGTKVAADKFKDESHASRSFCRFCHLLNLLLYCCCHLQQVTDCPLSIAY